MKLLVFVVLITLWSTTTIIAKKSKKYPDNLKDTHKVLDYSSLDLHGELRKKFFLLSADRKPESNTVCSPLSAILPLAKLALGGEGDSFHELLTAVGVSRKRKIHEFFQPLLIRLRYLPGVKLDIASRLYMSRNSHLHRAFRSAAVEVFQSSVNKVDFNSPIYAAEEINSWVSTQTNGNIKDIINPQEISPMTSLILVNAIYFNGHWEEPFEKVSNVTFHYSKNSQKNIEMMSRQAVFNYTHSEALGAKIISIPYTGGVASLVVVCPEVRGGLPALLAVLHLTPEKLAEELLSMKPTSLRFTMPKFKFHDELDLGLIYSKMGLKTIFDQRQSGLTRIVRGETVYLSSAKHKCYIDVNEFGTEAAAASVTNMAKLSLMKPPEFIVDHPFLYFILVNDQQLFSGTFVNPDTIS